VADENTTNDITAIPPSSKPKPRRIPRSKSPPKATSSPSPISSEPKKKEKKQLTFKSKYFNDMIDDVELDEFDTVAILYCTEKALMHKKSKQIELLYDPMKNITRQAGARADVKLFKWSKTRRGFLYQGMPAYIIT
jgi:hypothetical protein